MVLTWTIAALHLLALGIGLGSVWARARAFKGALDDQGIRRVLNADTWWGVAAALWVVTGLTRVFAGTDKVTAYYMGNWLFWVKMTLFLAILGHEIRPMLALMQWRKALAAGRAPDTSQAARFARISTVEAWLVVAMVVVASGMARGFGMIGAA